MAENKQAICDAFLKTLRLTSAAGSGNSLVELRYMSEGGTYPETVRPIFEDGNGENGWYDVNVSCDSGIAIIEDIMRQFVNRVW